MGKYPQISQENGPSATVSSITTGNANGGQVAPTHTYVKNVGGNIVRKHVETPIDTKNTPQRRFGAKQLTKQGTFPKPTPKK